MRYVNIWSWHALLNLVICMQISGMWFYVASDVELDTLTRITIGTERKHFSQRFPSGARSICIRVLNLSSLPATVYPKKYAHGFVVLCFVVVMLSFIMNSHEIFIHIHQGCFAGTGAIVRLPQCQWSKPDGYGKISQCITTTKHSKAKTVCIFLGIYCNVLTTTGARTSAGTMTSKRRLLCLPSILYHPLSRLPYIALHSSVKTIHTLWSKASNG